MPRKFIVRLRKGSVTGEIVANSQVINIDPLTDGPVFPTNFTDGRLQGKIKTSDRVTNFIKTIIPVPTTTTTTTSTTTQAPSVSTTTQPPGPIVTTTQAPTTQAPTTQAPTIPGVPSFSMKVSPRSVSRGGSMDVTITHTNYTGILVLGIAGGLGNSVLADGYYRPFVSDFLSPKFTGNKGDEVIKYVFNAKGSETVITLKFKSTLEWLLADFSDWSIILYEKTGKNVITSSNRDSFNKIDPNKKVTITKGESPFSIDVKHDSLPKSSLSITSKGPMFVPGDDISIFIEGLTSGTKYDLILEHLYDTPDVIHNFDDNWLLNNYYDARVNDDYEGWIKGGATVIGYPTTFNGNRAWYYTFKADSTTKEININLVNTIKLNVFSDKKTTSDTYKKYITEYNFVCHLGTASSPTLQTYSLNNNKDSNGLDKNTKFFITTKLPQLQVYSDEFGKTIREGSETFKFNVVASRPFTSADLGSNGIRLLFVFKESTPIGQAPLGVLSSDDIKVNNLTNYVPSLPGDVNFVNDITTAVSWTSPQTFTITANFDTVSDACYVNVGVYYYRKQDEGTFNFATAFTTNPPIWFTGYFDNAFFIEDAGSLPTITNLKITPTNSKLIEGTGAVSKTIFVQSANWDVFMNYRANNQNETNIAYVDVGTTRIFNAYDDYKKDGVFQELRGLTFIEFNPSLSIVGNITTYDTWFSELDNDNTGVKGLNDRLNSVKSGNLIVLLCIDALRLLESTREILNNSFGGTDTFTTDAQDSSGRYNYIFIGYKNDASKTSKEVYNKNSQPLNVSYTASVPVQGTNEFTINFTITDTVARTIYFKTTGTNIDSDDFEGPSSGNFETKIGPKEINGVWKVKADSITEGEEKFYVRLATDKDVSKVFEEIGPIIIQDTSVGGTASSPSVIISQTTPGPYSGSNMPSFIISGGPANSQVTIKTATNNYTPVTLDSNGSKTFNQTFIGEPTGVNVEVEFGFSTGKIVVVKIQFQDSSSPGGGGTSPNFPIQLN